MWVDQAANLSLFPTSGPDSYTYFGHLTTFATLDGNLSFVNGPDNTHPTAYSWVVPGGVAVISSGVLTVTTADGTVYGGIGPSSGGNASTITFPDGEVWTYYFEQRSGYPPTWIRPRFLVSSRGYGVQLSYDSSWIFLSSATWYNKAYVYCDETLLTDCSSISGLLTKVSFSMSGGLSGSHTLNITPPGRGAITVNYSAGSGSTASQVQVSDASTSGSTLTYTLLESSGSDYAPQVSNVTDGTSNWIYWQSSDDYGGSLVYASDSTGSFTTGHYTQTVGDVFGQITGHSDELGNGWTYSVGTSDFSLGATNFDMGVTNPEGDRIVLTRDARGNITEFRRKPKSGSGLADAVWTASYPSSCSNPKICNKPAYVIDANANQTDYTYDSSSGGVATVTGPAVGGVRPQTRYTYAQRYVWIQDGGGGYMHSGSPIWVLSQESQCRASSATGSSSSPCTGSDEILTSYDYGPDSGPNNLYLRGKTVQSSGQTLRTCYGYDPQGNKISETSPRAGLTSCP